VRKHLVQAQWAGEMSATAPQKWRTSLFVVQEEQGRCPAG